MSRDLLEIVRSAPACAGLAAALDSGRRAVATGSVGSSTHLLAGMVARATGRVVVLVVAHLDDADEAEEELAGAGVECVKLPALEADPGEGGASLEAFAERVGVVRRLGGLSSCVLACPIQALMQVVPTVERAAELSMTLSRGDRARLGDVVRWLDSGGYRRVDAAEEPGDFAVRGGILDVFPAGSAGAPVRLDFLGDLVESVHEVDPDTMGSDRAIERVDLVAARAAAVGADGVCAAELLPAGSVVMLSEVMEITEQGRGYYERLRESDGVLGPPAVLRALEARSHAVAEVNQFSAGSVGSDARLELPFSPLPDFARSAPDAVRELAELAGEGTRVVVVCRSEGEHSRLGELLGECEHAGASRVERWRGYVHRGFVMAGEGASTAIVPHHELMHRFQARRRVTRLRAGRAVDTFLDFEPGDFVVHAEHGIARFEGLRTLTPEALRSATGGRAAEIVRGRVHAAESQEYLVLEFEGGARLNVPAVMIDQVQKYVGGFSGKPPLSTLGGQRWSRQKERVKGSVLDFASELLRVRAARESMPGVRYPPDTAWQREFEASFPYEDTPDQVAALAEIKRDMLGARPMDRLLCGDVGFGKTELAIRAAFKAAEFGKQVAVLVPTTVLAEQHLRTFRERLAEYPFRVESLSRFRSAPEVRDILERLRKGHVDIVIGTHRLLSADVRFADLGLVVIDEEQRFGVEHKESLLRLRMTVDVLSMSATPIPRTLHMTMLGLRDISSLATPPLDRRAVVTEVIPYNERRIERAIARELARDGQVFVVHNRIGDIRTVADDIRRLAPTARIVVGHGQMRPHELEEVMLKFVRRQADILVSTTIIESGIDIPTANTMFVTDADRMGLAELHQLRGRVGRHKHRAYCYLLLPRERMVREVAQKRLKAIEQYSMLGAGFKIAMRDLEIRGAGNLLGAEQSGHIAAVGYDMYCRLLDEAVRELRHEAPPAHASATTIDIGWSGTIPRAYIPSDMRRLEAYRRLAVATSAEELARVERDLAEAYGDPPGPVRRLLELAGLRVAAHALGVRSITIRDDKDVLIRTENVAAVEGALRGGEGESQRATVRAIHDAGEVYFRPPANYLEPSTLMAVLRRRFGATA